MRKVLVVKERVSSNEIKAVDSFGRGKVLATASNYNVGDSILVVNDVIIQKVKREDVRVYEV